jgi:hypothetical protein
MGNDSPQKFQVDPHEKRVAGELFQEYEERLMRSIEDAETILIGEAERLVAEFRDRKKTLGKQVIGERAIGKTKPADGYSKLQMFTRWRGGSLQIYWQEVHVVRGTKKAKYKYIPFHTPLGYEVRRLQSEAGYAADLVGEYEPRAAQLRMYWSSLQDIKRATRTALQRLPTYASGFAVEQAANDGPVPRTQIDLDPHAVAG